MFLWGNVTPVLDQHLNCCNQLINVNGNWFGPSRTCDLGNTPPEARAEICKILKGCAEAANYYNVEQTPSKSSQYPSSRPA